MLLHLYSVTPFPHLYSLRIHANPAQHAASTAGPLGSSHDRPRSAAVTRWHSIAHASSPTAPGALALPGACQQTGMLGEAGRSREQRSRRRPTHAPAPMLSQRPSGHTVSGCRCATTGTAAAGRGRWQRQCVRKHQVPNSCTAAIRTTLQPVVPAGKQVRHTTAYAHAARSNSLD